MNEFVRTNKNRILAIILMILVVLGAFLTYTNATEPVTPVMSSTGHGLGDGNVGTEGVLTYEDLRDRYDIFCCAKGSPLPGQGSCSLTTEGGSLSAEEVTKIAKEGDKSKKYFTTTSDIFAQGTYTAKTLPLYKVAEVRIACPEEAYTLAEMINNVSGSNNPGFKWRGDSHGHKIEFEGDINKYTAITIDNREIYVIDDLGAGSEQFVARDEDGRYYYLDEESDEGLGVYSYVQRAWWNTRSGHTTSAVIPQNGLSTEADAFEKYIKRIATTNPITYTEQEVLDENFKGRGIFVKAPEVKYEPEWATGKVSKNGVEFDLDDVTVMWDSTKQQYVIGPFAIDYVEEAIEVDGRDAVQFAGITNATLYTDANDGAALERDKDWFFSWQDGQRTEDDDYQFPHEQEVFYIRLNKIEGATKIKDFHFEFKYMNAGARFENLQGSYKIVTFKADSTTHNEGEDDEYTEYYVRLSSVSSGVKAQTLAGGLVAYRWYNPAELHYTDDIKDHGHLTVMKKVVDEDGNPYNTDDYFEFNINIGGETEKITVKAGDKASSKEYYWDALADAPAYNVTEVLKDGYELIDFENGSGYLDGNRGVVVAKATNKKEPTIGKINIQKKLAPGDDSDETFYFTLTVTGTFKYNGQSYTPESPLTLTNIGIKNGQTWNSDQFSWYGDAPTYKVEEATSDLYEVTIDKPEGSLQGDVVDLLVTATNDILEEKAKLQIIKTLNINAIPEGLRELVTDEYVKDLKFSFKISVDGYEPYKVVLSAERENDSYVWKYTSDDFTWLQGHNPHYTIEEVDNPVGTHFDEAATRAANPNATISANKVEGTLVKGETQGAIITNNVINNLDFGSGKLEIVKTVNDDKIVDRDYKFTVTVTGSFNYKGVNYNNATVYLTNDNAFVDNAQNDKFVVIHVDATKQASWLSDEFTWLVGGPRPEYKVEENLIGMDDVVSTVNPEQGFLKMGEKVTVTAENKLDKITKSGKIHLIKTLENASSFPEEYIASLEFTFHITAGEEGTDEYVDYGNITLPAKRVGDSYVWEYELEHSWTVTSANPDYAPKYTIDEVNLPEGTEIVSSNGVEGSTHIEGTFISDENENFVVENTVINKLVFDKEGFLKIDKKVLSGSLEGKDFKFNVTFTGTFEYEGTLYENTSKTFEVTVKGGQSWTSTVVKWSGSCAPTYKVEEQESDIAELVSIINASGTFADKNTVAAQVVTATNKSKQESAYIQITKILTDGATSDETFYFDVDVEGFGKTVVGVKAGETVQTGIYVWDVALYEGTGKTGPHYKVTERESKNVKNVNITNGEGDLKPSSVEVTQVTAENTLVDHHGKLRVTKDARTDEKMNGAAIQGTFTVNVAISGTFKMDGKNYVDETANFTYELGAGESRETPEIVWYGDKAPTYVVTETNLPKGWKLESISNGNGELQEDTTTQCTVSNYLPSRVEIILTLELGGHVWEDQKVELKEQENAGVGRQGIFDTDIESGIKNIEVYVYQVIYQNGNEVSREPAKGWVDGSYTEIEYPLYTGIGGAWTSPTMDVPTMTKEQAAAGYTSALDVEFVYDGQTYKPTDLLVTSDGDANAYKSASTTDRDRWANDSMALDINRDEVDARIGQVYGFTPIDGEGNTTGTISGSEGVKNVNYRSADYTEGTAATRKVSQLVTTDANGYVLDVFKAKARTSQAGLVYPFDKRQHLESIDKIIDELGVVERYRYSATYNYTLNINLGLIKRPEVDMSAMKDLKSAVVVSNEKMVNYRFNSLEDIMNNANNNTISRQLQVDEQNISYELGVYKTDYYYRAEIYQKDKATYDAVERFYKSLGKTVNETELDVFLTYTMSLYNNSDGYQLGINQVNDYFDASFGAPVNTEVTRYVQTIDGREANSVTTVAKPSTVSVNGATSNVNWTVTEKGIKGSDGITYNKMVANFDNLKLNAGERAVIEVTFKVGKDTIDGVHDSMVLGRKGNVVEIANYTSYYSDGKVAGKIDRDSAPDNVNIRVLNTTTWYEDDTDSAPILNLLIKNDERKIRGLAWEDKEDQETPEGEKIGNGIYDERNEALLGGLTTELVEKVTIANGDGTYTDYDFVWPTNTPLDALGGRTINQLSGFDSTIETSRNVALNDEDLDVGEYEFVGIPSGNYIVRFLYGNDKTQLEDNANITGDAKAYKQDGTSFSGNEDILTANYEGNNIAVYNGQDFKASIYQATNEPNKRVNDARDSEARRLEIMANSQLIMNNNNTVLHQANDFREGRHTELFRDYYMFADTDKILFNIEDGQVDAVPGKVVRDGIVTVESTVYEVKNVDFAIEERAKTNIVLDKEISSIKLRTNDNRVIFDAEYDIYYTLENRASTYVAEVDGKYLVAHVDLNTEKSTGIEVMQAINKIENKAVNGSINAIQNFRYVNVDDNILQGCTVEIEYKISAINLSEPDTVNARLIELENKALDKEVADALRVASKEVANKMSVYTLNGGNEDHGYTYGEYLGASYYTGTVASDEQPVFVNVRQVIDYVDNDAVFTQSFNVGENSSWVDASVNEARGNGYDLETLISRDIVTNHNVIDQNNVYYITDQKNNIAVSVDNITSNNGELFNPTFEKALQSYLVNQDEAISTIGLYISRTVGAETDADNLSFDNLAEIVKYETVTGRRDTTFVVGNANPRHGEFEASIEERDASATELVTFTPPTGIDSNKEMTLQILAITAIALAVVAGGVVIIKKKILDK